MKRPGNYMTRLVFVSALAALAASCASAPKGDSIRVAIAGIESKEDVGGVRLAESVREHLQDELHASRRFEIVERRHLDYALKELEGSSAAAAGKMAGADWVLYGAVTQEHGGAHVHLRVIRVETGVIIYSGSRSIGMTAEGAGGRAAKSAVAELVREFSILPK